MVRRSRSATLLVVLFALSAISAASLAAPMIEQEKINGVDDEIPEEWPEGSAAYDNMVSLTQFGYRQIDTNANENARNWIAEELEGMGYEVERQNFTTLECNNCQNIVVTINGTLEDDWYVVGAHHDAICYLPPVDNVPLAGETYPGCSSSGAYDDGTGSGSLLELARTFSEWNGTPTHTWKLGWWDYEEWQGSGSSESGGKGSLHFVEEQIPNGTNVTYVNLDMFALNWPVPTLSSLGCDEDYWTLYQFTSPVVDWSYYENEGLEVTEEMQSNAEWFQNHLKDINENLSHPEPWVSVIDDTLGNSDHYNFIMAGHTATWIRGMHQNILEEGDTCEQTPKHAQTDSITTINTLAGGRANVEDGLQTGLDIVALHAWWDWNPNGTNQSDDEMDAQAVVAGGFNAGSIVIFIVLLLFLGLLWAEERKSKSLLPFFGDKPIDIGINSKFRDLWFLLFYLGFSMPFAFLGYWGRTLGMAEFGLDKYTVVAMFMVVQIPFFLRPLWAQPVEKYQTLPHGKRRSWMLYGSLGHVLLLTPLAFINVGSQPWIWVAILLLALVPRLFAEQAVAAMMAESVPQLGRVNSMINLAYRGGGHLVILLMGMWIGSGELSPFITDGITDYVNLQTVIFAILIAVMCCGIGITLQMKEGKPLPKAEKIDPFPKGTSLWKKVNVAMQTKTAWLVLLGCLLLPLGDGFEAWFSAYLIEIQEMDGASITRWMNLFAIVNYLGLAGPWVSDFYGRKKMLRLFALGSVVCYLVLGTSVLLGLPGLIVLIIWIPTLVLTDWMLFTFITTWADVADPRLGGTHMSIFQTTHALSATFVMVGIGGLILLASNDAYWLLFMLAAIGPAIGWLIFSKLRLGEDELGSDPWSPPMLAQPQAIILDAELEN